MSSVTLKNTSKSFGNFSAVKSMNLAIRDGEFAAILGPSGCGKTTTMNMIAGIEGVTSGSIKFDERDVTLVPMQKRGVGFVFQNYAIFTHMSVRDNLAFGLQIRGLPKAHIDKRVGDMAEFMALSHRLDERSSSLSVNEMQKLAIGRSAIVEPSIFLLDEPLSNLDAAFRERMRSDLRALQRALKQTMVYVTHDQIEAMGLADRIAVMNHAVLQQFDTPDAIYARPANVFVARFIGAPSMNIMPVTLADDGNALLLNGTPNTHIVLDSCLKKEAQLFGKKELIFGFRPETLSLNAPGTAGTIAAKVILVETVGRRRIVHLNTGAAVFLGVFDRSFAPRAGETVALKIDISNAHLFDPVTEKRLSATDLTANGGSAVHG
jgi:multiple sugar transport system ATP-binding protein